MAQAGLKLGPSPSRWTPNSSHVRRSCSTWRSLGWAPLATASRQVGPTETQHGEHCSMRSVTDAKRTWEIPVKMHFLTMSHRAGNVPMWSPCGAQFGPKLLGAKLRLVGPKSGQSWSQMGPSWVHVGALLAIVGPKVHPKLRTYGAQTWILTMLRPYAKDANYLNENHLFGGRSVLKMQPLLVKLYQLNSWFIRCIGSETKLPRVGFGVGGIIIIFHRIQWVPGVPGESKHFVTFHFPGPSATETSCLNEAVREFKWEQCQDQPTDGTWSKHFGFSRLSCAPWVKIRYVMYSFKVGWYASSCWRWWGFHLQHD